MVFYWCLTVDLMVFIVVLSFSFEHPPPSPKKKQPEGLNLVILYSVAAVERTMCGCNQTHSITNIHRNAGQDGTEQTQAKKTK